MLGSFKWSYALVDVIRTEAHEECSTGSYKAVMLQNVCALLQSALLQPW